MNKFYIELKYTTKHKIRQAKSKFLIYFFINLCYHVITSYSKFNYFSHSVHRFNFFLTVDSLVWHNIDKKIQQAKLLRNLNHDLPNKDIKKLSAKI